MMSQIVLRLLAVIVCCFWVVLRCFELFEGRSIRFGCFTFFRLFDDVFVVSRLACLFQIVSGSSCCLV